MKPPVVFCSGTVARTQGSWTVTWARDGEAAKAKMPMIARYRIRISSQVNHGPTSEQTGLRRGSKYARPRRGSRRSVPSSTPCRIQGTQNVGYMPSTSGVAPSTGPCYSKLYSAVSRSLRVAGAARVGYRCGQWAVTVDVADGPARPESGRKNGQQQSAAGATLRIPAPHRAAPSAVSAGGLTHACCDATAEALE